MSQPAVKNSTESKGNLLADSDDDIEDMELSDVYAFPDESENVTKKMATRRKIDLYLEKKRLKKELDYLDDFDFDFDDET